MLINLSAWLQPIHTFHLPRKEKSLPFPSTHLRLTSFFLWRQEIFTSRRAFLTTLFSLPHFMEEKTEAGSRGRASSGLTPLILRCPCEPSSHLRLTLCSQQAGNSLTPIMFLEQGWCQMMCEMMWLSRIHPVLPHPPGTPVSSFITFISYAWWSSSLSPQVLSLYHLLCAQEPPSLI